MSTTFKSNLVEYNDKKHDMYCIYIVDPQATWIKVGYGNLLRPGSNEYFTGYYYDAPVVMFITTMDRTKCFKFEQELHNFLGETFPKGNAGIECYKTTKNQAVIKINSFIKIKNVKIIETIETSVCEVRKTFGIKGLKNYKTMCLVEYKSLINCDIKCELCGKLSKKVSYECNVVFNSDEKNEEHTIYTGPNCFKKLEKSYSLYPPKFQSIFYNKLGNKPVIHFIDQYLIDSRVSAIPVKSRIDINNLMYKNIDPLIERIICHYLFVNKQSFNVELSPKEFEEYKLDIDIVKVYYILTFSHYFEIGEFDDNNDSFSIKFIHPEINDKSLLKYFKSLKSKIFNYSENLDKDEYKLDEIQRSFLTSQNPLISGIPGSGKSKIIKYVLKTIQTDILVISPTYQSLELLLGEPFNNTFLVKNRQNVTGLVIDAWNKNRKDLREKKFKVLLIDEFYMLNIFHLYKIKLIIEEYKPSYIKIFGDLYQLPCISFGKETENIMKNIHLKSLILTTNYRAKDYPDQVKYLDLNKTDFTNLQSLKEVFDVSNYSESLIENRSKLKNHIFLSSTNITKDKVNHLCYKNYKKHNCVSCSNNIKVRHYSFCSICIGGIDWIVNSNFKYSKLDRTYTKHELPKTDDIEYSNIVYLNDSNNIKYVSTNNDNIMLYNGQIIKIKINSHNKFDILPANKQLLYINDIKDINLSLGFAMTTHKAQGSTYKNVSFIVDREDISSDLVFTAITRASNMNTVMIINKTGKDDVFFGSTQFDINTDDKLVRSCNRIYHPKTPEKPYYGKKYIEIYKTIKEGGNKWENGWLDWMMGKKTNTEPPPSKHCIIFNKCERLVK